MASPKVRALAVTLVLSCAGLAGITHDEGTVYKVYADPVGIPTVCVGHTKTVTRADIGKAVTAALCDELLRQDTKAAVTAVANSVKVTITQGQFDALVSFTFNVGAGNLRNSTLLRRLNAGDCAGAASEFSRWVRARGKILPGLVTRRAREGALFREGC